MAEHGKAIQNRHLPKGPAIEIAGLFHNHLQHIKTGKTAYGNHQKPAEGIGDILHFRFQCHPEGKAKD